MSNERRSDERPADRAVEGAWRAASREEAQQQGFKNVTNVAGGMMGFSAAGLVGTCPICSAPHLPAAQGALGGK